MLHPVACPYPDIFVSFLWLSTPNIFESYIVYFDVPFTPAVIVATVRTVAVFDTIHLI